VRSATKLKLGKDPAYLEFVAGTVCICCRKDGSVQRGRTEVAHVGPHGFSQKCPDRETVGLCSWHHREGPKAHHKLGKRFWEAWGMDRDEEILKLGKLYQYCLSHGIICGK
jgi:hypothetical protein